MASSGNFATWNPLANTTAGVSYSEGVYSNGNTRFRGNTGGTTTTQLTHGLSSGKWYIEIYIDGSPAGGFPMIGIVASGANSSTLQNTSNAAALSITSDLQTVNGTKRVFGSTSSTSYGSGFSDGDICQMAIDIDNGKIWWGKNNTFFASGDPAAGSNAGDTFTGGTEMIVFVGSYSGAAYSICNAGQDDTFAGNVTAAGNADGNGFGVFKYSPPTGFFSVASSNLSVSDDIDPAGDDGETENPSKQFGAVLYTGNGGSNAVTGLGFQPDLVWGKCRSHSQAPILIDSVRGQGLLFSSLTNAEQTSNGPFMTSYDSDGFTLASSGSNPNDSGRTYVAWCWRAGGSASSDASGDITVNRSTNDKSKFSILTYTGNGSSGSTIAHGLGVKPAMTIIKERGATNGWNVWHQGYNSGDYDSFAELNSTASWYANQGSNGPFTAAPGTDYLTLTAYGQVNASSDTYVAYVWADVEGMQKFGSFEGNSDADGPFVYTGFRPQMVFVKAADATENWQVRDTTRSTFNANSQVRIYWNSANAEGSASTASPIDFLSNGFKVRGSNTEINGATMVYGAWADVPFKYNNTF